MIRTAASKLKTEENADTVLDSSSETEELSHSDQALILQLRSHLRSAEDLLSRFAFQFREIELDCGIRVDQIKADQNKNDGIIKRSARDRANALTGVSAILKHARRNHH